MGKKCPPNREWRKSACAIIVPIEICSHIIHFLFFVLLSVDFVFGCVVCLPVHYFADHNIYTIGHYRYFLLTLLLLLGRVFCLLLSLFLYLLSSICYYILTTLFVISCSLSSVRFWIHDTLDSISIIFLSSLSFFHFCFAMFAKCAPRGKTNVYWKRKCVSINISPIENWNYSDLHTSSSITKRWNKKKLRIPIIFAVLFSRFPNTERHWIHRNCFELQKTEKKKNHFYLLLL